MVCQSLLQQLDLKMQRLQHDDVREDVRQPQEVARRQVEVRTFKNIEELVFGRNILHR
jgi:hypothetical protein